MASFHERRRITRMNRWLDGVRFAVMLLLPLLIMMRLWDACLDDYPRWTREYERRRLATPASLVTPDPSEWTPSFEAATPLSVPLAVLSGCVGIALALCVWARIGHRRRNPHTYFWRYLGGRRRRRMARTRRRRMLLVSVPVILAAVVLWVAFAPYIVAVFLPRFAIPRPLLREWWNSAWRQHVGRIRFSDYLYRDAPAQFEAMDATIAAALRSSNPEVRIAALYFSLTCPGTGRPAVDAALDLAEQSDIGTARRVFSGIGEPFWEYGPSWQNDSAQLARILARYDDDPELVFQCAIIWARERVQGELPRLVEALRHARWREMDSQTVKALGLLIRASPGRMPYDAAVAVGAVPADPAALDPTWQSVPTALRAIFERQLDASLPWSDYPDPRWHDAVTEDTRPAELLFLELTRGQHSASERDAMIECIEFLGGRQRDRFFDLFGEWCLGEGLREENQEQAQRVLAWLLKHPGFEEWHAYRVMQAVRHDVRWRDVPLRVHVLFDQQGHRDGETGKVGEWLDWGVPNFAGTSWHEGQFCGPIEFQ